jgi:hypothetical protein
MQETRSNFARLAVLNSRAQEIIAAGYTFWPDADAGTAVCKPGELAATYWITEEGCTCPAYAKESICKHSIAADKLAEEAALEAEYAPEIEFDAAFDRAAAKYGL